MFVINVKWFGTHPSAKSSAPVCTSKPEPEPEPSETMQLRLVSVCCAALASAEAFADPFEIHVSDREGSSASGLEVGSAAHPFLSVHAARDAMRAGLGAGRPRTVLLSGDHHLPEPLRLDSRDTGSPDAPIVWRSSDPEDPARLTGGAKLPGDAFAAAGAVPSGAAGVMKIDLYSHGLNSTAIPGMSNPCTYTSNPQHP